MIRITRDELKSFLNDELIVTAEQLAQSIDNLCTHTWLSPLLMMKRVVESEELGSSEKMSVLSNIGDVADIVSLQVTIEGTAAPALITQDSFTSRLYEAALDPVTVLTLTPEQIRSLQKQKSDHQTVLSCDPSSLRKEPDSGIITSDPEYIPEIGVWLISVIIPLKKISDRKAILSARIKLDRIKENIDRHPFNKNGNIILLNSRGMRIFDENQTTLSDYKIVQITKNLLNAGTPITGVTPYVTPSGKKMLAGYTFPSNFNWTVIVEKDMLKAYIAVSKMQNTLFGLAVIGLVIAVIVSVIFSKRISQPVLEIGKVARDVGEGNFNTQVSERVSKRFLKDEISELGERINKMTEGLRERFQLEKFVSDQTMDAIKRADNGGIRLGGERKTATVFFSDIRGFTSFSEKNEPEIVINMINTYLRSQAKIVRQYGGDIDKYVGDELIAVFQDPDMVKNAVLCAVDIHQAIEVLNENHPEWDIRVGIGINTGEMVMGAMGSEERMDYTILGDSVNLGARLCSYAGPSEIILSENSYSHITAEQTEFLLKTRFLSIVKHQRIQVKGKSKRIQVYRVEN